MGGFCFKQKEQDEGLRKAREGPGLTQTKSSQPEVVPINDIKQKRFLDQYHNHISQVKKKPIVLFYGYQGPFQFQIKTETPELFSCFPKLINKKAIKWSGEIKDNKVFVGRHSYPYLFWESCNSPSVGLKPHFRYNLQDMSENVFQLLLQMGLSEEESTNFVTFWIHEWQKHSSWFIHCANQAEIDREYPLLVSPEPYQIKRFYLYFGRVESDICLQPIQIPKWRMTSKKTIVQWGGAIYDFSASK